MIRKNGGYGVVANAGKIILRGGTVSKNKGSGEHAFSGGKPGKVTVAKAEESKPQTVSKDIEDAD